MRFLKYILHKFGFKPQEQSSVDELRAQFKHLISKNKKNNFPELYLLLPQLRLHEMSWDELMCLGEHIHWSWNLNIKGFGDQHIEFLGAVMKHIPSEYYLKIFTLSFQHNDLLFPQVTAPLLQPSDFDSVLIENFIHSALIFDQKNYETQWWLEFMVKYADPCLIAAYMAKYDKAKTFCLLEEIIPLETHKILQTIVNEKIQVHHGEVLEKLLRMHSVEERKVLCEHIQIKSDTVRTRKI